jgi:phosphate starvation-inducible PhoH-like protein
MTQNQKKLEALYSSKDVILALGSAGTGKTFYSAFLALRDVFVNEKVDRIIYIRTAVQTRDQGFMPGDAKEKMQYYEAPMIDAVNALISDAEAYNILKRKKTIEFMSTSFIRGITLKIILIDLDSLSS